MSMGEKISFKVCSIESRFVIGPSNILFVGVYAGTFQPGSLTTGVAKELKAYLHGAYTEREPEVHSAEMRVDGTVYKSKIRHCH